MKQKYKFRGEVVTLPHSYIDGETEVLTSDENFFIAQGAVPYFDPEPTLEQQIADAIKVKLYEIDMFDASPAVNAFFFNGQQMWIDKATRVGLVNAATAAESLGMSVLTVGIGGLSVTLPPDTLKEMLFKIEMYALDCYNITLAHQNAVQKMTDVTLIREFDVSSGYPEKIELSYNH